MIQDLQTKGYSVCGLTARERKIWYDTPTENVDSLTSEQLQSANITFGHASFQNVYPQLAQEAEYYKGIFFVNTDLKGDYLSKILKHHSLTADMPKKIIFIDDKLAHVESVDEALTELNIEHEGYWYVPTEEKAKKFNPLIANIQLYYFYLSNRKEIL